MVMSGPKPSSFQGRVPMPTPISQVVAGPRQEKKREKLGNLRSGAITPCLREFLSDFVELNPLPDSVGVLYSLEQPLWEVAQASVI
jgi:hypothetical protein